jgi:hypothetical protein
MQGERRSLARLARDGDIAAVLPDRIIGHGKSQPGSFSQPFGREEGLENPSPGFCIPTHAGVGHGHDGRAARLFESLLPNDVLVHDGAAGRDGQSPSLRQGATGVRSRVHRDRLFLEAWGEEMLACRSPDRGGKDWQY